MVRAASPACAFRSPKVRCECCHVGLHEPGFDRPNLREIPRSSPQSVRVTKPLAIVFHESLLPGSQIANRLADTGWRVQTVNIAANVVSLVRREKPMLLVAELALRHGDFCGVIEELRRDPSVSHVPIIGYASLRNPKLHNDAIAAGARLVAADSAILDQLPQLLEHALAVE